MPASINDLDNDVKSRLAAFGNKLKTEAASQGLAPEPAAQQNTPVVPAAAIEPTAAQVVPTPAPAANPEPTPVAAVEVPATPQPEPPSTDPKPDADPEPEPWDKGLLDITASAKEDNSPLTLEDLGSALKIEKPLKSKADIVEHVETLRTKVQELEKSKDIDPYDGLDDDLKEVVKVARQKGDWKRFLGNLVGNVSNVDPVALFDAEVERDPRFRDPTTGLIKEDELAQALADVPLATKIAQGNLLKQQIVANQENRRAQILQAAERRQTEFNRSLASAAKKIPQTLSQEKFGIKLEPKHADYLYEGIRNGTLVEKHLGKNIDITGINSDRLIETIAKAEWAEQIAKFQKAQGIVEGKRNILKTTQNVQLNHPTAPPSPNTEQKVETAAEKTAKHINKYKVGPNSL